MEHTALWRRLTLAALAAAAAGLLTIPILVPLGDLWRAFGQTAGMSIAVPVSLGVDLALLVIVGALCALLARSWWSLLVVPAGYLVGWIAGVMFDALLPGHAFEGTPLGTLLFALGLFLGGIGLPLLCGAAIGTALGRRWRPSRRAIHAQ